MRDLCRPLRVAIVAPYDLSLPGGVNNQIRGQALALRGRGHAVEVFGAASNGVQQGETPVGRTLALTIGGTQSGLAIDPRSVREVARMCRQPFDVVHVHEPLMPLVAWLAVMLARAPILGTFHVHREEGHRLYAAASWALAPLARRLRARLAVSEAARRTVGAHFPGEYEIVPNAIDCTRFAALQPRPPEMLSGDLHVLYVGRLEPRKGLEYLITAMGGVQRVAPKARLILVGDGPSRASLTVLARETHVDARFVGGLEDARLPAFLQHADAVCAPAVGGESFGIVLLEAMAAGTPIVASRIEGFEALVGDCARLVPPRDPHALQQAILEVLSTERLREDLSRRGTALVRQYDWDVVASRLERIYARVLGG